METSGFPVHFRKKLSFDAPCTSRHGATLVYDDGVVSIAQRADKFAVIHTMNSRWFVTDARGAERMRRYAAEMLRGATEFYCHEDESVFLQAVLRSGFLEPGADATASVPTVMCLSITDRCNLECSYCFYAASHKNNLSALHVSEVPVTPLRSLFEQAHQLNPNIRVYLTGGEPFANPRIMEYLGLVKEAGLYAGVVTNGVLLTEKRLQAMRDLAIDEIRISIDGVSRDTHEATRPGTHKKVMSALKRLEGKETRVVLSMTVTKENQHECRALARFARERGFVVSYSHMVPAGRGSDHFEMLPDYERLVVDMAAVEKEDGFPGEHPIRKNSTSIR